MADTANEDTQNGLPAPPDMAPRTQASQIYPGFFYDEDYQGNKTITWKGVFTIIFAIAGIGFYLGRK